MKKMTIKAIGLILFLLIGNLSFSQQVLYGVTGGPTAASQTIFSYNPSSNDWTKEFTFPYVSGQIRMPVAGMTMAPNGKFYGVCNQTYTNSYSGGIYEFDPETGVYTQKVQFYYATPPGASPSVGLMLASNGKLYGTTYTGGNSNVGEIFEFDPSTGTITQTRFFYTYVGHTSNGALIEGTNGKLYGVTTDGGEFGEGSIYEYDISANSITRLYGFPASGGGRFAWGKLLQASDGLLYGTTQVGSSTGGGDGVLYSFNLSTNTFTELVKFDGAAKGSRGTGNLIEASNGSIYGTTERGGTSSKGVLFEYNIGTTTFTKHYDFDGATGQYPDGKLFEFSNGKLYGMTPSGGPAGWSGNDGVMFEFDLTTNTFAVVVDGNLGWPYVGTRPNKAELAMYCKSPKANQTTTAYSFCEGEAVSIHLNSINSDSYVWKKLGVAIGQTTDSLNFSSFLLADAGTYTCEMTNVCGMVSSAVFTITGNTSYNSTETESVCSGGSYTFPDGTTQTNITSQVVYTSNFQAVNTCDSTIVTTVNVNPTFNLTETESVCSGASYTFPDGTTQSNITSQVIYTSSLQTVNSCDSIIVTTVNVNPTFNLTETESVCSGASYTFPDGTTQSNITSQVIYTSSLQTVNSCDSIIVTTVNVNPTFNLTETESVCSGASYTFPDGTTQSNITSQVIYTSSLQTVNSCDSIIVTTVNVNPTFNLTETESVCSGASYTFPDGTTQSNITSQVIYTSSLQTINSCDSIIVTTVNVNPTYNLTETESVCSGGSYAFPDGTVQSNITSQVIYTSSLQTVNSCDSIIVTTVNVNLPTTGTDTRTECSSFVWLDGITYTNNNTAATHNLTNAAGCDSVITLDLTITTVDTSVTQTGTDLTANELVASYQWLDCNNNYAVIPGATFRTYYGTVSGSYAVAVTSFGCTDTSSCYSILITNVERSNINNNIFVYPNPVQNILTIRNEGLIIKGIKIIDLTGRVISEIESSQTRINVSSLSNGIYVLEVRTNEGVGFNRFIKE